MVDDNEPTPEQIEATAKIAPEDNPNNDPVTEVVYCAYTDSNGNAGYKSPGEEICSRNNKWRCSSDGKWYATGRTC